MGTSYVSFKIPFVTKNAYSNLKEFGVQLVKRQTSPVSIEVYNTMPTIQIDVNNLILATRK